MNRSTCIVRYVVKGAIWLAPGMIVLGTSCAQDVQNSMVAAGLDFVKSSSKDVLTTVFPIKDYVNSILHPPAS